MCKRAGHWPVMSAARVGEQTGAAAYACVKHMPCAARRSRFGVSLKWLLQQPSSVQPRSSARTRTMLGGLAARAQITPNPIRDTARTRSVGLGRYIVQQDKEVR